MWGKAWPASAMAVALAGVLFAGTAAAQVPEGAKLPVAEEHNTVTLGEPGDHRVYVLDPVFPHLIAGKVYVVDGDEQQVIGTMNAGYVPNLVLGKDGKELYFAETFWSRGTRGERTDVVTTYDASTLSPTGEVKLPQGRFLVVTKRWDAISTPDGRFLLSYNMDPATSVSVVDLENDEYVGEIETPGCALMYPMADRRFAMLCADGSLLTVDFDENGEAELSRGEPFFDAQNDPVFEHAAVSTSAEMTYYISYNGMVYPTDMSGETPEVGDAWSLVTEEDKAENWRPGGWMPASYHPGSDRLFVLMHQGGEWTHKNAGSEIWVFDASEGKRLDRIELEEHAASVAVTKDDEPLLYALTEAASLSIFDAANGYAHKGTMGQLGDSPLVLMVHGE